MNKRETLHKRRVWEVDAVRGYLILWVLFYHLYFTVYEFCINGGYRIDPYYYVAMTDPLQIWFSIDALGEVSLGIVPAFAQKYLQPAWVNVFFVISGISCIFSRNNLKSGIRLLFGAAFISLFTKLLAVFTGDETQFIRFGVLHCYAVCHLIYYFLFENRKDKYLLLGAGISLLIGYYLLLNPVNTNYAILVPFGFYEYGVHMRDYWPVFPMLGWFLIGVVMGRHWYKDKKSRFANLEDKKWHRPLRFLGRYSGLIYCGHMVIYTVVFLSIGYIFQLY